MAEYLIQDSTLTEIADAIRETTGGTNNILVEDMAAKIKSIETLINYENTNTTSISDYAYYNFNKFKSVSFPKATSIGSYAFSSSSSSSSSSSLTTISFPLVETVGSYAFYWTSDRLESINLPCVIEIGSYAFFSEYSTYSKMLSSISLPICTKIGSYAFCNHTSLTTVDLPKVTNISLSSFSNTGIETLNLPELLHLGDVAFSNCRSLESINIPKVYYIPPYCFFNCSNLKHISIEGYVDSSSSGRNIKNNAFENCISLQSVVLPNATDVMPLLNSNAFLGTPIANGTGYIYVPDSLVDSYKTANNWSVYASQIKPLSGYVE